MSRYNPDHKNSNFVFEAAEHWRDECLLQDGSVFSDKELWSKENFSDDFVDEFLKRVIQNAPSKGDTFSHLLQQLEDLDFSEDIYQLMAESLWVMCLGISASDLMPGTKKKRIETIWKKSGAELPNREYLEDKYMEGLGKERRQVLGNFIGRELSVFIFCVYEIKKLGISERKALFIDTNGKEISQRLDQWSKNWEKHPKVANRLKSQNRHARHILLHLLFPDHFERVFSGQHKQDIITAFKNPDMSKKTWPEIDETLRVIREEQEKQHGTEIDFYDESIKGKWWKGKSNQKPAKEETQPTLSTMPNTSLNQILYGPPGTGKTWSTVHHALSIIEGRSVEDLEQEDRAAVKERFEKLKESRQIEMVTFHQSFAYEDFIEGIKPVLEDDSDNLDYEIVDGIFKTISNRANDNLTRSSSEVGTLDLDALLHKFAQSITDRIEQAETIKLSQEEKYRAQIKECKTLANGQIQFKFIFPESGTEHSLSTNMIFRDYTKFSNGEIKSYEDIEPTYDSKSRYHGHAIYLFPLMERIKEYQDSEAWQPGKQVAQTRQEYVLIIDEINRGNIAKIFGELITLIEPSKRSGEDDATSIILPYSKDKFGVPVNLHIIGTMNTADRSIALLDTALRRRFDFIEMMPQPDHPRISKDIEGVNCQELLQVMNQRITALLDREHQIGHSYLIDVDDMEKLAHVFQNKIIPLLQEYFYEDWAKIYLVLNENKFVSSTKIAGDLFRDSNVVNDDHLIYELLGAASPEWKASENYKKIYNGD